MRLFQTLYARSTLADSRRSQAWALQAAEQDCWQRLPQTALAHWPRQPRQREQAQPA